MTIDLHIHSKASDGKLTVQEIFKEAKDRNIGFLSITDHDSIGCQTQALALAKKDTIRYYGSRVERDFFTQNITRAKQFRWIF